MSFQPQRGRKQHQAQSPGEIKAAFAFTLADLKGSLTSEGQQITDVAKSEEPQPFAPTVFDRDQEVSSTLLEIVGKWRLTCSVSAYTNIQVRSTQSRSSRRAPISLRASGRVGALGDGDAKAVEIEADLGDETCCAGGIFNDRAPECLAVTHQYVDGLSHARLSCHPLLLQGLKSLHIELNQQQAEGRVRRWLGDVGAQQLVEGFAVALGVGAAFSVRSNAPCPSANPGR
jgi:hypothetical protein